MVIDYTKEEEEEEEEEEEIPLPPPKRVPKRPKYPMDDLELAKEVASKGETLRPEPPPLSTDFGIPQDCVGDLFFVLHFMVNFRCVKNTYRILRALCASCTLDRFRLRIILVVFVLLISRYK